MLPHRVNCFVYWFSFPPNLPGVTNKYRCVTNNKAKNLSFSFHFFV